MDKASEALLALKPVAFRYKKDIDPNAYRSSDLMAEQVEKVNPTSSFATTKATLHRSLRSGERDVAKRVPQRAPQSRGTRKAIIAQTAGADCSLSLRDSQKVSAQLEACRPAPHVVDNP